MVVFAGRGDELPAHPLGLQAQHHHHVRPRQRGVEIVEDLGTHPLDPGGHQRRRSAQADGGTQRLKAQQVRACDPAMHHVPADHDHQAGEILARLTARIQRLAQRQRVEQRLRRVLVLPVARVEHRAVHLVGDELRRPAGGVADHDRIGAHGVQRDRGVDQRLALLHARLRGVHVDHIRAEPLARDLEAEQRARRVFEEGVDDGQSGQQVGVLGRPAAEFDPLLRLGQQEQDFMPLQPPDAEQVAVREGQPPCGKARW